MRRLTLLLLLLVVSFPGAGWGRVLTVGEDGVPDGSMLASTVENAADGDTVLVYPGFYEGVSFKIVRKQIVLKSVEGPEKTILDGNRVFRPIWIYDADETVIEGFTIQNGHSRDRGGAVYVRGDTHLILRRNIIKGCDAQYGGAIYLVGGCILEAERNLVTGNSAYKRGGAIYAQHSELRLTENTFLGNRAEDVGSAISIFSGRGTIERNLFGEHQVEPTFFLHDDKCDLQLQCNGFWGNTGEILGGGAGVTLPENRDAMNEAPHFVDRNLFLLPEGSPYRGGKCGEVGWSL